MKPFVRALLATLPAIFAALILPMLAVAANLGPGPDWMRLPESTAPSGRLCEDLRIIVTLKRNEFGSVETLVKGRPVFQRELIRKLLIFAERRRDEEHPMNPSEVFLDLRVEPDIPWHEVRRVLDACEDPDVRIYKIRFAVRPVRR